MTQERTGQRKTLLHTSGEFLRLFTDDELKCLHGIFTDYSSTMTVTDQTYTAKGINQLFITYCSVKSVEKILPDCAGNEEGNLRRVVEQVCKLFLGVAFLISTEQINLPLRVRIVSVQTTDQAGFPTAVSSLQSDHLIGRYSDAVIPSKRRVLLRICYDHIFNMNLAVAGILARSLDVEHLIGRTGCDFD